MKDEIKQIKYEMKIEAEDNIQRTAKLQSGQSSCTIYVPPNWDGKKVMVIRLPTEESKDCDKKE